MSSNRPPPQGGSSGTFAIRGDGEGLVGVLLLPLTGLVLLALLSFPSPLLLLHDVLGLAALHRRFPLALALLIVEDGTDRLLAGGEVGSNIKQLVCTRGWAPSQLTHQILACRAQMKGTDNVGVGDAGELSAQLGEVANVITQGLVRLLTTPSEIPRIPMSHVCALEVAHEGPDQVRPVVDLVGGEVFEPCVRGIYKVQSKVTNDNSIITHTAQMASQAVVVEP